MLTDVDCRQPRSSRARANGQSGQLVRCRTEQQANGERFQRPRDTRHPLLVRFSALSRVEVRRCKVKVWPSSRAAHDDAGVAAAYSLPCFCLARAVCHSVLALLDWPNHGGFVQPWG
ncbi:hypothetical protein CI102_7993 [Trichoderma harzianum]|uniref:Uncharacterized protein n=1 Tax=Trichoderma harzianum CBS 226.95 TaxID=983964 RepID=A0A2T4A2L1_TRIHA|nr:hypothetical protein M431DRAFT_239203 [Trichoderma harzianum CBS 226.95]PKK46185.1 hypothetical protein CI102_7993 [Trichoderma harzianum]PTB51300.1 hypothetical protein M431DRAFT_239203 [Trichoderma harzianum CBS 226.95]